MTIAQGSEELKVFLDELNENLTFLDDAIISLEESPQNKEILEEIFRVAHTIKGSAGFLDLQNLVSLGHAMESVFIEFHTGATLVTKEVIDVLLECKDAIHKIGVALANQQHPEKIEVEALVQRVKSFLKGDQAKEIAFVSKSLGKGIVEAIEGTRLVRVWISAEEVVPSIRGYMVRKKLSDISEIIKISPPEEVWETDDFFTAGERLIQFWIKSDQTDSEIIQNTEVDLIDKIEVFSEAEQKAAVAAAQESQSYSNTESGSESDKDVSDTVRIPVSRLDILLNLVGELVIANSGFQQVQEQLKAIPDMEDITRKVRDRTKDLYRISAEIQELVMKSRLVPIATVFNRFKRFVRDYSRRSDKLVELSIAGSETEIDKKIIDELIKPLTHLVRNSLDHGIETVEERRSMGKTESGKLRLVAYQEGNFINIVVEDDGRGLDFQTIVDKAIKKGFISADQAPMLGEDEIKNFIFRPGFSTKSEADELSGRGIGMDVVKHSVEALNGTIDIATFFDTGTKIIVKLPLTLAILNALIVQVADEQFSIPMSSIVETQKVPAENFLTIEGNEMVRVRDSLLSLIRIDKLFELNDSPVDFSSQEEFPIIIVEQGNTLMAILVDQFINRQEMVIKSLSEHYRHIDGISGASILGDGSIILILDIHSLVQLYREKNAISRSDGNTADETWYGLPVQNDANSAPTEMQMNIEPDSKEVPAEEPGNDGNELSMANKEAEKPAVISGELTSEMLDGLRRVFAAENLSSLKEWIKLGNAKVVEGIQQLTGSGAVRIGRSKARKITKDKVENLVSKLQSLNEKIVDFTLPILPLGGAVHFIITHTNAIRMVKTMWEQANLPPQEEYTYEPLLEVTNILGSAYTNSLTDITDVLIEPGLPSFYTEGVEQILEHIRLKLKDKPMQLLYIENQIFWGDKETMADIFIMLPDIG